MSVYDKIKDLLQKELGVDPATVQPLIDFRRLTTTKNLDDGEPPKPLDSLDKIEFVMALEEGFEIEISDDEASRVITIAEIVALVEVKLGQVQTSVPEQPVAEMQALPPAAPAGSVVLSIDDATKVQGHLEKAWDHVEETDLEEAKDKITKALNIINVGIHVAQFGPPVEAR